MEELKNIEEPEGPPVDVEPKVRAPFPEELNENPLEGEVELPNPDPKTGDAAGFKPNELLVLVLVGGCELNKPALEAGWELEPNKPVLEAG